MDVTKQKKAFLRKLYLAYLIDTEDHNLPTLHRLTGMPRRTIQDTLKDLPDIGIQSRFEPVEGGRHNEGFYQITDWGPIKKAWIKENLPTIQDVLRS